MSAGPLDPRAMMVVARRLRSFEDWAGLAAWYRGIWEGGLKEELPRFLTPVTATGDGRQGRMWAFVQAFPFQQVLVPYAESLVKLNRKEALRQLQQDLEFIQPGLAKRLDESANPRTRTP